MNKDLINNHETNFLSIHMHVIYQSEKCQNSKAESFCLLEIKFLERIVHAYKSNEIITFGELMCQKLNIVIHNTDPCNSRNPFRLYRLVRTQILINNVLELLFCR